MHEALDLEVHHGRLAVCRLPPTAPVPDWADVADPLVSITRTADELSIVAPQGAVPPGVPSEDGWCALAVRGPLDFALTGILAGLALPLAEAGVPIFVVSTYETDWLLVREGHLDDAITALEDAGHRVSDRQEAAPPPPDPSRPRLILASRSPRRLALLRQVGLDPDVLVPDYLEEDRGLDPRQMAATFAAGKAAAVVATLGATRAVVLAADTVVAHDRRALGKPRTPTEAREMLRRLSGTTHVVTTAFVVRPTDGGEVHSELVDTEVTFRELDDDTIARYVTTGEPMDKAGGYGIQGRGALLVASINGDYSNVVGLPLPAVTDALARFGVDV